MDKLLYIASSGASQDLVGTSLRANNLANAQTNGFKAQRVLSVHMGEFAIVEKLSLLKPSNSFGNLLTRKAFAPQFLLNFEATVIAAAQNVLRLVVWVHIHRVY